ncbi:MAG: EF-P beta-lysylation protein EpmB [Pseudomonadales bacterium]|nr:EF-P beta-lysylation protein EpmB [Pseudomonadales bacterium]
MIPLTDVSWQTQSWQQVLSQGVKTITELNRLLDLDLPEADTGFPMLIPATWLARINPGDPADPLLLQVLPVLAEQLGDTGFVTDPLQESQFTENPGMIRKYQGRVLVIVTGQCAVNCRYCFRRHFPYEDVRPDTRDWDLIAARLTSTTDVHEVILSGGDPLVLNDRHLAGLISRLEAIPHLRTLRIHSRLPVAIPQRVTPALVRTLGETRLKTVLVNHINHANEIDQTVINGMQALRLAGVQLLNQSVLLRGVNDSVQALTNLSHQLWEAGVLPYYLHQLDPVEGAAHFDVPDPQARQLIADVRAKLPGYLVPRLVREIPDRPSKTPL